MKTRDLWRMALANLWLQKLRTFLTVTGVTVGVSALVLMVSLGVGVKLAVLKHLNATNLMTEVAVLPMKISLQALVSRTRIEGGRKKITRETIDSLRGLEGVQAVYPMLNLYADYRIGETYAKNEFFGLPAEGVTDGLREAVVAGRMFQDGAAEAIVGDDLARTLQFPDPAQLVGKKIELLTSIHPDHRRPLQVKSGDEEEGFEFEVVGVYRAEAYKSFNPRIYLPQSVAERIRLAKMNRQNLKEKPELADEFPALSVRVKDLKYLEPVKTQIESMGYGTLTIDDVIDMVNDVFLIIECILGCVGGVGLLVAFFGIANTMLMSILERTREIGIMKALGATRRNIGWIFLLEAGAIGVLGGVFGIGGGWLLGRLGNWIATAYAQSRGMTRVVEPFAVSWELGVTAVAFALVVSVVAGLYPAVRAARLDPVVALRHE